MDKAQIRLNNLDEKEILGRIIGRLAEPGDVVCLDGDLGSGKTAIAQAIALGMGVSKDRYVTSPSFALLHQYEGRIPLYHMDFYRLENAAEVEDLGLDEYFYLSGMTVIEWSRRAIEILPNERISLEIIHNNDQSRTVNIEISQCYTDRLLQIVREF